MPKTRLFEITSLESHARGSGAGCGFLVEVTLRPTVGDAGAGKCLFRTEKGHGRIEIREVKIAPIEAEACGFPHARQVVEVTRRIIDRQTDRTAIDPKTGHEKIEARHFITSLGSEEVDPAGLARLIRGHWSVENRNHWKRDAS